MRGECVAEGEASKKAGEGIDDEDLEDVFHNCTRWLLVDSSNLLLRAGTQTARRGTSTWCAKRRASCASAGRPHSGMTSGRLILKRAKFSKS